MTQKSRQFFIVSPMTLAELYKQQLDTLIAQDITSQQKTQATLERIKKLVETLKNIDCTD